LLKHIISQIPNNPTASNAKNPNILPKINKILSIQNAKLILPADLDTILAFQDSSCKISQNNMKTTIQTKRTKPVLRKKSNLNSSKTKPKESKLNLPNHRPLKQKAYPLPNFISRWILSKPPTQKLFSQAIHSKTGNKKLYKIRKTKCNSWKRKNFRQKSKNVLSSQKQTAVQLSKPVLSEIRLIFFCFADILFFSQSVKVDLK
jgi:hypothetical protein